MSQYKANQTLYTPYTLERKNLNTLFVVLQKRGYTVFGPTVQNGSIVLDNLTTAEDLPRGWTDEQNGGSYRLMKRSDDAVFGFTSGPQSWKKFLHLASVRLWQVKKNGNRFQFQSEESESPKVAFFGVRACDFNAIQIQDTVFTGDSTTDHGYQARRSQAFVVALNCGHAGKTCFCVSMNTGPKAPEGYDLVLTEILEPTRHYFLIEGGSDMGREVLKDLPGKESTIDEIAAGEGVLLETAGKMGRTVDTTDIRSLLNRNSENPRFLETAKRCLTCTNCTMVCPTCFCSTSEDTTDLTGQSAERVKKWDSCFTLDFSYIHGGNVRSSVSARYRQWLTHKFAAWIDQFGTSGCVGCGRCITWCPVGIDVTEEIGAIRERDMKKSA